MPGFRLASREMRAWPLVWAAPPAASLFSDLVRQAGRRAGEFRRVEVPFWRVAPADEAIWTRNSARGLEVGIGRAGATKVQAVQLGQGTSQHVLVAGKTGSGKSTLLHALITNAALNYSPDQLEMYLVDFKKGVEFKVYARWRLPHARVIAMESDREFGVSVLEKLDALLQERSTLFREAGVADLAGFRQARPQQPLPRVLFIVDEFQEFFVEDDSLAQTASLLLDRLVRQGRAFGVHVVLGSQTLAGAYSLARSTLGQIAVRIALQCSETDAHLILSEDNTAARLLTRPGEAIYNDANGLPAGNQLFQVVWLADDERDRRLSDLQARGEALAAPPAIVFEGHTPVDFDRLPVWQAARLLGSSPAAAHVRNGSVPVWLGEAVSLRGALSLDFPTSPGSNLLVVGQDESAALGVLAASATSVASLEAEGSHPLGSPVLILNGSPQERSSACWRELAAAIPDIVLAGHDELAARLQELVDEVRRRDGQPGARRWLCLFDLVRFRKLRRKDDDYGFGGFDKAAAASPSDLLAELLRDGPPVGIHTWLWCDSANTVQRWLSREMQQHCEQRVVFAMNATDSSQLIDSPAASRLGPHRAWLFNGDRGTLEKFRPYRPPEPGWLTQHTPPGEPGA
jgi:S-DNA-T family DNA segregation ATPase FtsK/SpoIIIE